MAFECMFFNLSLSLSEGCTEIVLNNERFISSKLIIICHSRQLGASPKSSLTIPQKSSVSLSYRSVCLQTVCKCNLTREGQKEPDRLVLVVFNTTPRDWWQAFVSAWPIENKYLVTVPSPPSPAAQPVPVHVSRPPHWQLNRLLIPPAISLQLVITHNHVGSEMCAWVVQCSICRPGVPPS